MPSAAAWTVALVGATALHAGFQLTVTAVVYPALAAVPSPDWGLAHGAHSRRIAPLVAVVYGAALVAVGGAVIAEPSTGALIAGTGTVAAVVVTALSAAPTHGRLGPGRDDALVLRLLRADRLRCLCALIALAGALLTLI